jgi:hypothetical protein
MSSAGTSRSLRGQARAHTFTDVGASEGFAAARVMWICVLWALIHSVLASKQAKNLARRVASAAPDKWVVNDYPAHYETTNLRASFE